MAFTAVLVVHASRPDRSRHRARSLIGDGGGFLGFRCILPDTNARRSPYRPSGAVRVPRYREAQGHIHQPVSSAQRVQAQPGLAQNGEAARREKRADLADGPVIGGSVGIVKKAQSRVRERARPPGGKHSIGDDQLMNTSTG
ncbi:hypothetical protein PV664_35730 [Streptomyces sp. ME01-18a]|uniref:hypothetical protein n=1 Tax=Streptomyces sp. ME01-18a TaxID=3028669 RepID=UPI0029AE1901|nr:hypothetical protein [Streptomyces sp. ME01-18a]MDX3434212.1 hypothetical protein [Streptomyces sp. ME01-18a]